MPRRLPTLLLLALLATACAAPAGERAGDAPTTSVAPTTGGATTAAATTTPIPTAATTASTGTAAITTVATAAPGPSTTVVDGSTPTGPGAALGPLHLVEANGITLAYRRLGSGSPVVLIAGQNSGMDTWGTDLPLRLARDHEVVLVDNRGVGRSTDDPSVPLTIGLMGDDTAALVDALGLDRPVLVGWSTGGEIALAAAVRHPDRFGALVVSGATAGGRVDRTPAAVRSAGHAAATADDLRQLLGPLFPASAAAARDAYLAQVVSLPRVHVPDATVLRQAQAEARYAATTETYDGLARLRLPVVVTNGGSDPLIPPWNAQLIASRIRGARLVLFAGASHGMIFQDLDRFQALVESVAS